MPWLKAPDGVPDQGQPSDTSVRCFQNIPDPAIASPLLCAVSGSMIKRLSKAVTLEIIYKTDIVPRTLRVCFCSSKFYSLLLKVLYFI